MYNVCLVPFQLITILLKENAPQVKRLPIDDSTLQSVTELRIDIVNVSDADATTLELHVLGCIKGAYVSKFLPRCLTTRGQSLEISQQAKLPRLIATLFVYISSRILDSRADHYDNHADVNRCDHHASFVHNPR